MVKIRKKSVACFAALNEFRFAIRKPATLYRKAAFTLTEVLITLTILGVIAGMTIPNIVQNYKKIMVETRLKLIYSQLSKVIDLMSVEYEPISGIVDKSYASSSSFIDKITFFCENYLNNYLNYTVECPISDWRCREKNFNYDLEMFNTTSTSSAASLSVGSMYRYKLKNRINLFVAYADSSTFYLIADINGNAKPNKIGYDVFYFAVHGTESDMNHKNSLDCGKDIDYKTAINVTTCSYPSKSGKGCSCPIMLNNFKIPNDYPVKNF